MRNYGKNPSGICFDSKDGKREMAYVFHPIREIRKDFIIHSSFLREYRTIRVVGWQMNFPLGAPANFAGLLAASQGICRMCMAEKASPDMPLVCAVFP